LDEFVVGKFGDGVDAEGVSMARPVGRASVLVTNTAVPSGLKPSVSQHLRDTRFPDVVAALSSNPTA
jgi:hypothetical protein